VTPLAGRLAVVTGASRGIGAETAAALARAGARVVRVARSLERGSHDGFDDLPCDMADPAAVAELGATVLARSGTPDIIVSNAGVFDRIAFERASVEELQRQLAVNLVGPFALARVFLPAMRARGSGLHISVGSVADHTGFPENAVYSATKYGLRGLHEALSAEYRGSGVRFSLVSPGPTDTAIWDPVGPNSSLPVRSRSEMLRAADVAEAMLFVATRPSHVTIDWLRLGPT
jgi:NAD(P)-dependent dehydrogenase (short-subunit alcohol dehydrogenase family)